MAASKDFHIAIIGGGIAGLTLAIALHHREIPATLYESAPHFGEIGAGVSFASNTVQAMEICHPGVLAAFNKVRTHNGWESKRSVWFDYHDGTIPDPKDDKPAFEIRTRIGQNAVHRAQYLDELVKLLPADKARFGKRLVDVTEGADGRLVMSFLDGTTAIADAVIGCDGIKSRVRQLVVGEDHPSARPSYTYKYAYRGLVPMDKAVEAVGEDMARNSCMHMGPDRHVLTFPISGGTIMNMVAFVTTPADWPSPDKNVKPGTREDCLRDFEGFGYNVTSLLKLTNEDLSIWAIYDTGDHPPPTYVKGRLCIAGDAAHATSPHHGSGAGFCIEDSAVMATLLADERVRKPSDLEAVFATFDAARRERCQWLVQSSRFVGDCYEWRAPGVGKDFKKIESEINERLSIIGDVNVQAFCDDATEDLVKRLSKQA